MSPFRDSRYVMRLPAPERDHRPRVDRTANDRLKAGVRNRFHWSIVGSVVIHGALIAGWPEFERAALFDGTSTRSGAMELVTLGSLPGPGRLGILRPATPVETVAEPEDDHEEEEGSGGLELIRSGMTAGERLGGATLERLASLTPSFVGPLPEPDDDAPPDSTDAGDGTDPQASDGEDPDGLRIREGTSELTYERLSNEELLELERLSALRPELALLSPSSWLMVQNPTEVGAFMRDRFRSPAPDEKPQGYLSVSVWIDERGSVEWAEINRSSGRPELDASALELFQRVVAFRPARNEGLRVPVAAIFWLMW